MKCKEINSDGSFLAWGVGFHYEYDANQHILEITTARDGKPLTYTGFDTESCANPFRFVLLLEKATQIQALMLSNNATIDLSENFEDERLVAIFISCMNLAQFAYDLSQYDFKRFEKCFCADTPIKLLNIEKIESSESVDQFFSAKLSTDTSQELSKRAKSLHHLMIGLSDSIISDLITAEYGFKFKNTADTLLSVSSKLSLISLILNEAFIPVRKLVPRRARLRTISSQRKQSKSL